MAERNNGSARQKNAKKKGDLEGTEAQKLEGKNPRQKS